MKKIFILLLVLTLAFTFTACKDNQSGTMEIEGDGTEFDLDTSDLDALLEDGATSDAGEETYGDSIDLGAKVSTEYAGSVVNEKVDYTKIADMGEAYQKNFLKAVKLIGDSWNPSYFYDDTEEEGVGDYLEVQAMEDDNEELAFVQAGVYKDLEANCYSQYLSYCSDSVYPDGKIDLTEALSDIEKMFGIEVSKEKLESAASDVFKKVKEQGYYYSLSQEAKVETSDYTESVVIAFEADYIDETSYMGYVYCCRERTYK